MLYFLMSLNLSDSYVCGPNLMRPRKYAISASVQSEIPPVAEDSPSNKLGKGVTYDGSSGAALSLQSMSVSVGNYDILNELNWEIMPKERWGIVGQNGAGKSTLLRTVISGSEGNINIRSGSINIAKKSRIGYLEQKGVSGSTLTLRQEVTTRMDRLTAATKAYELAETALSSGDTSDEALLEFERAAEEYEAAGGYTVEQKIGSVLKGEDESLLGLAIKAMSNSSSHLVSVPTPLIQ